MPLPAVCAVPLVRFLELRVLCAGRVAVHWVHRGPCRHACFHARRVDSRSSRSPERTVRLMPSCSRSSSEFLRSHSRPLPFGSRPTARVSFLFATSPGASTCSRTSQALDTFRPQVLSTSRRLSPRTGSAGLFHPAAASRTFCSFRGSPSLRSRCFLIGSKLPPCRCSPGRSPEQVWSPRSGALGFEAFVRAELAPRRVGS
jgi:hypothetical protein